MNRASRVAVVTGAGSGIGRVVARSLLIAGDRVALAGRREDALRETLAEAEAEAGAGAEAGPARPAQSAPPAPAPAAPPERALVVPTDVTDEVEVDRLFSRVAAQWGRVDLLFNNAGLFGAPAPLEEFALHQWRAVVETNLTGSFLCAQRAFAAMKAQRPQGGRIINNGSISAHVPRPHAVAYTASKHAITGLTKAISLEGREFNIACGQVDIGNAVTALSAGIGRGALQADGSVVVEPMMDVRHAADAVLYMASLPLDANVQFLTVMATNMPYIGRG